jgi:hypothetical protein
MRTVGSAAGCRGEESSKRRTLRRSDRIAASY